MLFGCMTDVIKQGRIHQKQWRQSRVWAKAMVQIKRFFLRGDFG